jgi:hypothetical protein
MIPGPESWIKSAAWGLVFCVILFISACGDDEPVEKVEPEAKEAKEAPLPEREWYPRQKRPAFQPQMMQPPAFDSAQPAQQQSWDSGYQTYPAPQVIIVQPPTQWYGGTSGQAPAQQMTAPQQYVTPYYSQAPQRPWGVVPQGSQRTQPSYSQPQSSNQQMNPWSSWQAPEGTMYPGWGIPYGGYPGTPMPGYVW